jgi:chemotaxis signal transduction protein
MHEEILQTDDDFDLPWLTFTLRGNAYAINSKFIDGIMTPPDDITPIPDSPAKYIGMLNIRGDVFPLLDMRKQFKLLSVDEEIAAFEKCVDDFIELHKNAYDKLKSKNGVSMLGDELKCPYTHWAEKISRHAHKDKVSDLIQKAETHHRNIHAAAVKIDEHFKKGDKDGEVDTLLKELAKNIDAFTEILKEAEYTFKRRFRETIVNLSLDDCKLGIMVDEVLGVGEIEMVRDSNNLNTVYSSNMFEGVGKSDKTNKEILIINEELLIKQSEINVS